MRPCVIILISHITVSFTYSFLTEGCFSTSQYFENMERFIKADLHPGSHALQQIEDGDNARVEYCHDLETHSDNGSVADHIRFLGSEEGMGTFFRQYSILVARDFAVAIRDPALYYLQFALIMAFGFLVGATFFKLKFEVGNSLNNIPGGLLWVVFEMAFVQIFKVLYCTVLYVL